MTDSFNTLIKERFRSPLYGTFILAFLLVNWQAVYITLFVKEETLGGLNKLEYIIYQHYSYSEDVVFKLFIFPLSSTVFFLFLFPFFDEWSYKLAMWFRKRKKKIRQRYDSESLIVDKDKAIAGLQATIAGYTADVTNLRIVRAIYGSPSYHVDVTEKLRELAKLPDNIIEVSNDGLKTPNLAANSQLILTVVFNNTIVTEIFEQRSVIKVWVRLSKYYNAQYFDVQSQERILALNKV